MPRFKINDFDKVLLNTLKKSPNSGVTVKKVQHRLSLHPIHLHDVGKSIDILLKEGLSKYQKKLGGIVLGYQNVKLLSDKGFIVNDSFYIHIDIEVEFFVFTPEIGKEMQGIVNKKSSGHIGVLVYDAFNVSIHKPRDDDSWLGNSVQLGEEVFFRISNMNMLGQLPYIEGKLISKIEEGDNQQLNPRKRKKNHPETTMDEEEAENFEESPKHKNKRKKSDNADSIEEPHLDLKKKKKKKSTETPSDQEVPEQRIKKRKNRSQEPEEILPLVNIKSEVGSNEDKKKKKNKHRQVNEESVTDWPQLEAAETVTKKKRTKKPKIEPKTSEEESDSPPEPNETKVGRENSSFVDLNFSELFDGAHLNSENGMDGLESKKSKKRKSR